MKPALDIIDRIGSKHYFGALPAFRDLATWTSWITWLKALFALPMNGAELGIFRKCTGREDSPVTEPTEAYTIVGRRGGKSFISALTAVHVACFRDYKPFLNAGETAVVLILILARDRDQAKIVFRYVKGILNSIPVLAKMIAVERADEIELNNQVTIMVKTSDYRAIRGLTVALCILDEIAFWDSQGLNPDREILTALRPSMATIPGAKLLCISTAYAKAGVLFEAYREHYGQSDDHVLVWQADTRTMNPTLNEKIIQRELEKDPESARAEWLGEFREDLEAAFSLEAIEACIIRGRDELPASSAIAYRAFADPSGGQRDAFTLGIAHRDGAQKAVIDYLGVWKAKFDPSVVVAECAEILRRYGCVSVTGDNYGGEWPASMFRAHGINYERATKTKSELYLALVPAVNSRSVELPDQKPLIDELRRLERRRGRLGKDSIDHPINGHDDLANSAAGCSWLLLNENDPHAINAHRFLVEGAFYGVQHGSWTF
jgi:terminase large subunit-like protein